MPNKTNIGDLYTSNNEFNANVTLTVGDTTTNIMANSTLIRLANSTVSANLSSGILQIGANVVVNTSTAVIGTVGINATTVNATTVNTGILNATNVNTGTMTAATLNTATLNTTSFNLTSLTVGANVIVNTTSLSIGTSAANVIANSSTVRVFSASGSANLQPTQLVIGGTTVNTSALILGSGGSYNSSTLTLGSGGSINWNAGDITLTHGANYLSFAGGTFYLNDNKIGIGGVGNPDYFLGGNPSGTGLTDLGGWAGGRFLADSAGATQVARWYSSGSGGGFSIGSSTTAPGSGRLRCDGILFGGDTAATNVLDDYEEGSWTPRFACGGSSTGVTYSSRSGQYTKIGNFVHARGATVLSNNGSGVGTASINDFPFSAASGGLGLGYIFAGGSGFNGSFIEGSGTSADIRIPASSNSPLADEVNCTNSFNFNFEMQYLA